MKKCNACYQIKLFPLINYIFYFTIFNVIYLDIRISLLMLTVKYVNRQKCRSRIISDIAKICYTRLKENNSVFQTLGSILTLNLIDICVSSYDDKRIVEALYNRSTSI